METSLPCLLCPHPRPCFAWPVSCPVQFSRLGRALAAPSGFSDTSSRSLQAYKPSSLSLRVTYHVFSPSPRALLSPPLSSSPATLPFLPGHLVHDVASLGLAGLQDTTGVPSSWLCPVSPGWNAHCLLCPRNSYLSVSSPAITSSVRLPEPSLSQRINPALITCCSFVSYSSAHTGLS